MRTPISEENPFGANRYGFLWEVLAKHQAGKHLDYGAYNGAILRVIADTGLISAGVGVDVNREVVAAAQASLPPTITLSAIGKGGHLPFSDDSFDSISVLDVIEHINDQAAILKELRRVLKPGGIIVVTVPRKHIFSFLDLGNWKFVFPRLHRFYISATRSADAYRARYQQSPDGLVGDIEVEKAWHQHFSNSELGRLLEENGYQVLTFDGTGLFARPLSIARLISPGPMKKLWEPLLRLDAGRFASTNLFCVASKLKETNHQPHA